MTLGLVKYFETRPLTRSLSVLEHTRLVNIRADLEAILVNWEEGMKESRERALGGRIGITLEGRLK